MFNFPKIEVDVSRLKITFNDFKDYYVNCNNQDNFDLLKAIICPAIKMEESGEIVCGPTYQECRKIIVEKFIKDIRIVDISYFVFGFVNGVGEFFDRKEAVMEYKKHNLIIEPLEDILYPYNIFLGE